MKYLFFTLLFTTGLLFNACSDMGKEAKTEEAKKVPSTQSSAADNAIMYTKLSPNSYVEWRAAHLGGVNPRYGKVRFSGVKALAQDNKVTKAKAVIDLNSLTVESFPEGSEQQAKLTNHLKSADFFEVNKYPTATFELTKVEPAEGAFNAKVTGNLTIKGVTKSITFPAKLKVTANEIVLESAPFTVDRSNWGLTYNRKGTAGVPVDYLISDDIGFKILLDVKR